MIRLTCAFLLILFGVTQASSELDWSFLWQTEIDEDSSEYGQYRGEKSTTCDCGWTNKASGRIVGGKETYVNEFPHMAGLIKSSNGRIVLFCGASILTPYHAITAAHCTIDQHKNILYLLVGEHDLTDADDQTDVYRVKKIIEHQNYNDKTIENDISILILNKKITFSKTVGPICMPTSPMNSFLVDKNVKVTGWGKISYDGPSSPTLLKVNVRVVPLKQCVPLYLNNSISEVNPTQFCTYGKRKDSCQGDSGGPVTWLDPQTNRYTLVGLVSFGKICGSLVPAVNTDVYAFRSWIQTTIESNSEEPVNICSKII